MSLRNTWFYIPFLIIFCLISFVNHYNFKTANLDLGVYTNALYDYSRFRFNYSEAFKTQEENILASHFDLYLPIFSLCSYLFKSYTLLIVQIVFVLLGGVGVSKVVWLKTQNINLSRWASVNFFLFFGIYTALAYDYHSNVVAAMLFPWLLYYLYQKKYTLFYLVWFFMIIGQENSSLWLVFIGIGLMFQFRKELKVIKRLMVLVVVSAVYFYVITQYVMPYFRNDGGVGYRFEYAILGDSVGEALVQMISQPFTMLKYMVYENDWSKVSLVKIELIVSVLLSGGLFLYKKPSFLIMLIPIFFQKLLHNNPAIWGVGFHYSIAFSVVLSVGAFLVIGSLENHKVRSVLTSVLVISSLVVTIRIMDNPIGYVNKGNIRFYQQAHYERNYELNLLKEELDIVPHDAIVSTQSSIIPNLSYRDKIYLFPNVKDAEYIIYSKYEDTYPLGKEQVLKELFSYIQAPEWERIVDKEYCTILKRRP